MTVIDSNLSAARPAITALKPPVALPRHIELRWSCTAARCPLGELAPTGQLPGAHELAEFTIAVDLIHSSHALIRAKLEFRGRERTFLPLEPARCDTLRDGRWLHVDLHPLHPSGAVDPGQPLLKLTLDAEGNLVYAQSRLLAKAGLPGGSFDRPRMTIPAARA